MTITEADAVAKLLHALAGHRVDIDLVADAAVFCEERVHKALLAGSRAPREAYRYSAQKLGQGA